MYLLTAYDADFKTRLPYLHLPIILLTYSGQRYTYPKCRLIKNLGACSIYVTQKLRPPRHLIFFIHQLPTLAHVLLLTSGFYFHFVPVNLRQWPKLKVSPVRVRFSVCCRSSSWRHGCCSIVTIGPSIRRAHAVSIPSVAPPVAAKSPSRPVGSSKTQTKKDPYEQMIEKLVCLRRIYATKTVMVESWPLLMDFFSVMNVFWLFPCLKGF